MERGRALITMCDMREASCLVFFFFEKGGFPGLCIRKMHTAMSCLVRGTRCVFIWQGRTSLNNSACMKLLELQTWRRRDKGRRVRLQRICQPKLLKHLSLYLYLQCVFNTVVKCWCSFSFHLIVGLPFLMMNISLGQIY